MKTLIQFLLVKPALAAVAFARRHPVITGAIVILFFMVMLWWQVFAIPNLIMAKVRKFVRWLSEEGHAARKFVLLVAVWFIPGGFILWAMLKFLNWWSERPVKVTTEDEEPPAVWQPQPGTGAEGRFS